MRTEPATPIDVAARVGLAVSAVRDRKALDLRVLHLEPLTEVTEYFLICSGTSERQVQAIADGVKEQLRDGEGVRPLHVEGRRTGRWVLLDFGAFVVHVFDEQTRAFYDLERLWADAPDVTREFGE